MIGSDTVFRTPLDLLASFTATLEPFESCYYALRRGESGRSVASESAFAAVVQESSASVHRNIEQLFVPLLGQLLSRSVEPGTAEALQLYRVVPPIRNYLALSQYFIGAAYEYLYSAEGYDMRRQLKAMLGRATEIMEAHASYQLERIFKKLPESSIEAFILALTDPRFEFRNVIYDFERIPAAQAELNHCRLTPRDHVLFIGCGSLSVSGLAYANAGAQVTLVDIDPMALDSFSRVHCVLPDWMKSRIHRTLVKRDDYSYLAAKPYSHICLAGLVSQKEQIISAVKEVVVNEYMRENCGSSETRPPAMLVRAPKPNLLDLFYYDCSFTDLISRRYQISEPSIEAPIVTHIGFFSEYEAQQTPRSPFRCPYLTCLRTREGGTGGQAYPCVECEEEFSK